MSFYVSNANYFWLHCDEWDRVVALPRHKFVTGATLLQLQSPLMVLYILVMQEISESSPSCQNSRVVVSPETEVIYVFNHYGQHKHTVNIMTDQFMYNFTYNVNSFYGKLEQILDDAGNKI